jgi:hypothetical protein
MLGINERWDGVLAPWRRRATLAQSFQQLICDNLGVLSIHDGTAVC